MPSIANQPKNSESPDKKVPGHGYSTALSARDKSGAICRQPDGVDVTELSIIETDRHHLGIANEESLLDGLKVWLPLDLILVI